MISPIINNLVAIAPEVYSGAIKPPRNDATDLFLLEGKAFATNWKIILYAQNKLDTAELRVQIEDILNLIDFEMSPFRADSFISRLNNAASDTILYMPDDFRFVMLGALNIAKLSNGCFDPCLWETVQEWGFGAKIVLQDGPDQYMINRLKKNPNWESVRIDGDKITKMNGQSFDLCAIAKGYAVDKVSDALSKNPLIAAALIEIGGELKGFGLKPEGMPWWVDIGWADVKETTNPVRVALYNMAIATSGDTFRGFEMSGKTFSHTMNPHIGAPADTNISSVSVIDKFAWRADAIATALMVMGSNMAMKFANENQIPCVMRLNNGDQAISKIFKEWCD
jgi:thiamine biosynthesis lipoprotein